MKIIIKKKRDMYFFYNDEKQIFVSKKNPLFVFNEFHANNILTEINSKKKKDQYSLISLTNFSCALDFEDKKKIIQILLESLKSDFTLFRFFEDKNLQKLISQNLDVYVKDFSKKFGVNLKLVYSFETNSNNLYLKDLKKFLSDLNIFLLSCFYKLSCFTKSVILSYFFIINKISYERLFELTNIENHFQQKRWGYIDEQEKVDKYTIDILKKISIFLKNIN